MEGLSSFNHNASSRLSSGMTHATQSLAESTFAESTVSHTRKRSKGGMCEVCITSTVSATEAFFSNLSSESNHVPV